MSRITLRHDMNEDVHFLHIVNFLVSYNIMSLEEANGLYRKFKLAEDVVFDIRDEMGSEFRDELDSLKCKYEVVS
jgi:hypothetical protein